MQLPIGGGNVPWPPKELVQVYDAYREHAAWYSGRASELELYYGGYVTKDRTGFFDPTTTAQPLTSVFRRMFFWARQQPSAVTRSRYHVPIASDISTISSDQLFADPPRLLIPEAHAENAPAKAKKIQQRLDDLAERTGLFAALQEGGEVASALGGSYLQTQYDADLWKFPLLQVIHPDSAVPEFKWGRLTGVIFWRQVDADGSVVFRHLELHSPGKITHGLYRGTERMLGMPVPLTDVAATARFAGIVDSGSEVSTGLEGLDCVYIPNMRPDRQNRGNPLGRSDYQAVEDLMDAADETMTSWMRDIRLGKARAFVAEEYVRAKGKGQGGEFDTEREFYEVLKMTPEVGQDPITFKQFEIRTEQHEKTLIALMERIVASPGYSGATFGLKGAENVEQTATEVVAKEHRTLITRGKKIRYWAPALADILEAMLGIDRIVFKGPGVMRPRADFPEMVHESLKDSAQSIQLLHAAAAISLQTKIQMAHPEWDIELVKGEMQRIADEKQPMPSVTTAPPNGGPQPVAVPPGGAQPAAPGSTMPTNANPQEG